MVGLAFDYSETDMGVFDDIERFMLTFRMIECDRGLDLEALITDL
jgi:hypothetical protein